MFNIFNVVNGSIYLIHFFLPSLLCYVNEKFSIWWDWNCALLDSSLLMYIDSWNKYYTKEYIDQTNFTKHQYLHSSLLAFKNPVWVLQLLKEFYMLCCCVDDQRFYVYILNVFDWVELMLNDHSYGVTQSQSRLLNFECVHLIYVVIVTLFAYLQGFILSCTLVSYSTCIQIKTFVTKKSFLCSSHCSILAHVS